VPGAEEARREGSGVAALTIAPCSWSAVTHMNRAFACRGRGRAKKPLIGRIKPRSILLMSPWRRQRPPHLTVFEGRRSAIASGNTSRRAERLVNALLEYCFGQLIVGDLSGEPKARTALPQCIGRAPRRGRCSTPRARGDIAQAVTLGAGDEVADAEHDSEAVPLRGTRPVPHMGQQSAGPDAAPVGRRGRRARGRTPGKCRIAVPPR